MLLVATHIPTNTTVHFSLRDGSYNLGRATGGDPDNKLSVVFDPKLSRRTAVIQVERDRVHVARDGSRYPLYHEGVEKEQFTLLPGQRFSSAETVFELISQTVQTLTVQAIEQANRANADQVLQVLLGLHEVLNQWHGLTDLAARLVVLLRQLLPGAQVAFFRLSESGETEPLAPTSLRPSRSLVAQSLTQNLSLYHVWDSTAGVDQPTRLANENWALVAPVVTSTDRLVLYALGHDSHDTPGESQRSALGLVAQTLTQHLEARRVLVLAARVEAEQSANRKLRILLHTLERSLSLEGEQVEDAFLTGAQELTGAESAGFHRDLSEILQESNTKFGVRNGNNFVAIAFEHYRPKGLLCERKGESFSAEDEEWLSALLGFAETVFENRRLHARIRSALEELKQSQAQLIRSSQWAAAGRLAASAAHELNTPLGAIRLAAETARSFSQDAPKPTTESLKLILRSVERCKKVTERLLVYSKPREQTDVEEFSLEVVVQDSLSTLGPMLRIRPVNIEVELADVQVRGDVQDCYWAVTNVIRNAFEAMRESDDRRLRLSTRCTDREAVFLVEDSGPGLARDIIQKLFEPFTSSKKMGEGNGLGLAISRRNLRAWGGDIELATSSLGGAAFALRLPLGD